MRISIVDMCDNRRADAVADALATRLSLEKLTSKQHSEILGYCKGDILCSAIEYAYRVLPRDRIVAVSLLPLLYRKASGEVRSSIELLMREEAEKTSMFIICADSETAALLTSSGARIVEGDTGDIVDTIVKIVKRTGQRL